jgi:hypothetical protein
VEEQCFLAVDVYRNLNEKDKVPFAPHSEGSEEEPERSKRQMRSFGHFSGFVDFQGGIG